MRPVLILLCVLIAGCGKSRKETTTVVVDPGTVVVTDALVEGPVDPAEEAAAESQSKRKEESKNSSGNNSGDSSKKSDEKSSKKTDPTQLDSGDSGPQRTIAGLGDPGTPGLWLQTPLVTKERGGRVVMVKTGASARVTLVPSGGPVTGGSQLSLQGFQALGAPLTQLVELDVYPGS